MWGKVRLVVALALGVVVGLGLDRLLAARDVQALHDELAAQRLRIERLEREVRDLREPPPLPPPELPPLPPRSPATPDAACETCLEAASKGDVVGAAGAARGCVDEATRRQCVASVKKSAPGAAKTLAFNDQCGAARAVLAAAEGMGAGSSSLKRAVSSCR